MAHAILSPSSASRWMACTPSARLERQFPETSGDAAKEGTVAHELGELMIAKALGLITVADYNARKFKIKQSEFYCEAMEDYADDYKTFVLERLSEAKMHTADAVVFLEHKLDLTEYVPEGFGTGDCIIVADGVLDIIDLKYGKGVLVTAIENKQMMLYGLGALRDFDFIYDIHTVRMTIYQPRKDNFSTFEMTVSDLRKWADEELKPRAELAFKGEGEQIPGNHCGFCKAKATCRAMTEYNLALARYDFKPAQLISNSEIAEILPKLDLLTEWANALKKYALDQALNGEEFEGFKVVEGKAIRKIADEAAVAKAMKQAGWPEDAYYSKKLVGITTLEKHLSKKGVEEILGAYIHRPAGAPTLVPATDKRPAFNSAVADFQSVN